MIDRYSFYSCDSLKAVQLPENLEGIGDHAFNGVHLEKIYIPKSVGFIDRAAFGKNARNANNAFIALTAFYPSTVIYCHPGSYAIKWAKANGFETRPAQEFSLD